MLYLLELTPPKEGLLRILTHIEDFPRNLKYACMIKLKDMRKVKHEFMADLGWEDISGEGCHTSLKSLLLNKACLEFLHTLKTFPEI